MKGYIPHNYVLVRPDKEFRSYQFNGKETGISTATEAQSAGQRLSVRGTIVKLPNRLIFNGIQILKERRNFANNRSSVNIIQALVSSSVLFDVAIEPSEGDIVFFSYLQHYDCYDHGRYIETPEGDLLLMKYDSLICSHKLNNIKSLKMLNGLVMIEPYKIQEAKLPIEVVSMEKYKNKVQKIGYANVLATGKLCNGYLEDLNGPKDTNQIKVGQKIIFKPLGAHLLEWGLHQVLFKGRKVMAIHRKNILMIQ